MPANHCRQIDGRQHIAIKDNSRGVNVLLCIFKSPTRTQGRSFNRIPEAHAVIRTILEKVFDLSRLIRQAKDDFMNLSAQHEIELIQEERRVRDRNDRLRSVQSPVSYTHLTLPTSDL